MVKHAQQLLKGLPGKDVCEPHRPPAPMDADAASLTIPVDPQADRSLGIHQLIRQASPIAAMTGRQDS